MSNNREYNENLPELIDRNSNEISYPRISSQTNINQYFDQSENIKIENSGAITNLKAVGNMRVLSINPKGCVPNNQSKMNMLKEAIKKYQIDILMMNETNTKWNTINESRLERQMKSIDRENSIFVADSKEWTTTDRDYLPGGIMSIFFSKCSSLINRKKVVKGRLGNWMAVPLEYKEKRIEVINMYRIPSTSSYGVCYSLTQYNRIDGTMNTPNKYRKEIFEEIIKHVKDHPEINDILIGGDYNQYLNDNEIKQFHEALEVHEIHPIVNAVPIHSIGKTYKNRSKPIDSIAATSGLIEYVDGYKLLGYNDVVESDHRSYMIEIAIEDYFNEQLSEWDSINKVVLNPVKRSHRKWFIEELENQLQIYNVENDLDRLEITYSNEEIEMVDELITRMLNVSTKKVEGIKRTVPYSKEKEKRRSMVLYYKMIIKEFKGGLVDQDLKEVRKFKAEILNAPQSFNEAKEGLKDAKTLWDEIVENGREYREKELLDYHPVELTEEGEKLAKKKKKVLAGIRKKLSRDHTFHYLSRHVGKGVKNNIKRLQVKNQNGSTEIVIKREDIEEKIKDHNTRHFKKAHNSIAFKDRIYNQLKHNTVRDKILNGSLQREDCDDERVYCFLKLLKQNEEHEDHEPYQICTLNTLKVYICPQKTAK